MPSAGLGEQFGHDGRALAGLLAGGEDGLGHALTERPMMIDPGEAEIGEREPAQRSHHVIGGDGAGLQSIEQFPQVDLVHGSILADRERPRRTELRHR